MKGEPGRTCPHSIRSFISVRAGQAPSEFEGIVFEEVGAAIAPHWSARSTLRKREKIIVQVWYAELQEMIWGQQKGENKSRGEARPETKRWQGAVAGHLSSSPL